LNIASTSSSSRSVAVLIKKKDAHVLLTPKASVVLGILSIQLSATEVCGAHYESPGNKNVLVMAESSIGPATYGGMNASASY
jgi:hypothetical protein